ncbi:caspase family protein [Paraburkholderia susongensis]|uniref:Uncharacterized protein, contains caspase domain n=1 Tax=Paraburkholderia susongensis TaxID=1515439 RepID=A0A1X7ID19_9BURK|nr:caspase family protein [Paraburkholderia susongensis]SMG12522.1 Uncharacterized protein, contains caspase domain [Paraburkholderia susongensis]
MRVSFRRVLLTLLCLAVAGIATCADAASSAAPAWPMPSGAKVALVIGNSAYAGADRLLSPANDARLIGETLRQLGFDTHVSEDLSRDEFNGAVDWLAAHAQGAQVVVFYYAGHGFEASGDNFLVPVRAGVPINAMTRAILLERAIRLDMVRTKVKAAQPGSFIALIDACRVPSRGGAGAALKRESAARGELIAYSTAGQASAYDSMRTFGTAVDDGPFAYYLSMYMKAPNATIKGALEQTQQQVSDITRGQQRPWIESGLIGDVTLARAAPPNLPAPAPLAAVEGQTRGQPRGQTHGQNHGALPQQNAPAAANFGGAGTVAADAAAQQRADSWDDAEYRLTMSAQHSSAASIRNLRGRPHDPAALTTLGMMAEEGLGMPRDTRAALAYYRRAAQTNYPIAQTLLGEAYFEGKIVNRDYDEAEKWLARAAAQDYTRAKLDLAQLRAETGQGDAARNLAEAMTTMMNSMARQSRRPPPVQ